MTELKIGDLVKVPRSYFHPGEDVSRRDFELGIIVRRGSRTQTNELWNVHILVKHYHRVWFRTKELRKVSK